MQTRKKKREIRRTGDDDLLRVDDKKQWKKIRKTATGRIPVLGLERTRSSETSPGGKKENKVNLSTEECNALGKTSKV